MSEIEQDYGIGIQERRTPKILCFDLEVSPSVGYYYPPTWETSILQWTERQKLMSFSWQWINPDGSYSKPKSLCLYDMETYSVDPQNDLLLSKELHKVMSEADILLGHNSDQFDIKMANYFFLINKLGPTPHVQTIDTKKVSKNNFRMNNNTLDNVSRELGHAGKTKVKHSDIWKECFIDGDRKMWKKMCKYNENDVLQTTLSYLDMRPFMRNHPNMARIAGLEFACPECLSEDYHFNGTRFTKTTRYRRFQCNSCHHFFSELTAAKKKDGDIKPAFA